MLRMGLSFGPGGEGGYVFPCAPWLGYPECDVASLGTMTSQESQEEQLRVIPYEWSTISGHDRVRVPASRSLFLFLACLLLHMTVLGCSDRGTEEAAEPPPVLVEVMTVEVSTESIRRRYVGHLHPWESHQVGFLTGGRVTEIRPSVGDELKAGQLIARLDPSDHSIYVDLAAIQKDAVEPNLERVRRLVEQNVLPRSQLDELEAKYQAALTQQRQASLALSQTRLTAPVSGVVMMRLASAGQVIGPGMPVVVLLEIDRLKANFGVPQRDLAWFSEGDIVEVRVLGFEHEREGKLHSIDVVPDPHTRTYGVSVALDNSSRKLRPGMICHLELAVSEIEGIFVPLTSVRRSRDGSHMVKLLDEAGDRVATREVELGQRVGENILIAEGLSPGERILVRGQTFVRDGDRVLVR